MRVTSSHSVLLGVWIISTICLPANAQNPTQPAPTPAGQGSVFGNLGQALKESLSGSPVTTSGAAESPNPLAMILPQPLKGVVERYNIRAAFNGDFVYNGWDARELEWGGVKRFLVRELELGLSAEFTPSVRGDIVFAAEREDGEDSLKFAIEEGYLTFLALPLGFQARLGKFKAAFGKANQFHTHARPWIDVPAPIESLFGEEGLTGTGVSITHLVPNPWNIYSEIAVQIFHPTHTAELFESHSGEHAELVHWRNVFDLTQSSTFELGLTLANIDLRDGGHAVAEGVDATYKWKPIEQGLYHSLTWQSELYHMHKDGPIEGLRDDLWGAYTSLEYQFTRRLFGGTRFDFVQSLEADDNDFIIAPFVTFRQNERIFYRLQYNHGFSGSEAGARGTNEIRFQFNISLGTHPPHAY